MILNKNKPKYYEEHIFYYKRFIKAIMILDLDIFPKHIKNLNFKENDEEVLSELFFKTEHRILNGMYRKEFKHKRNRDKIIVKFLNKNYGTSAKEAHKKTDYDNDKILEKRIKTVRYVFKKNGVIL